MKGLKLYALVGTFAVAATCSLPYAFAKEAASGNGTSCSAENFNELSAGHDRGVRLDELFASFKKPAAAPVAAKTTTVARLTPDNPLAHSSLKSELRKHGAKTSKSVAHKSTKTTTTTATTASKLKQPVVELDPDSPVVTAKYEPKANDDSHLVTVSDNVSHGDTSVISAKLDRVGNVPKYKAGEQMVVKIKAQQDCNVIVFDYDAHGTLTQLFPNAFEKSGTMHAGENIEIGGPSSQYTLDVTGKGTERIFVYAYPTSEGQITVAMNPIVNTPFRSAELSIDQYRQLVRDSRPYFHDKVIASSERTVSVKAKNNQQQVAEVSKAQQANKVELVFQVDAGK